MLFTTSIQVYTAHYICCSGCYHCAIFLGAVIGFTNLGDINSHLLQFERALDGDDVGSEMPVLANSMLVVFC